MRRPPLLCVVVLLLIEPDGVRELDRGRSAPPLDLGMLVSDPYDVEDYAFRPGDRFLLYTDGVHRDGRFRRRVPPPAPATALSGACRQTSCCAGRNPPAGPQPRPAAGPHRGTHPVSARRGGVSATGRAGPRLTLTES
ncbi:SpoIIE family protein phosphatase [Streptomyces sp. AK04-3B]|uniref:SpoIIE family protein phosphatase n=1 Tax=Streptomyces sp. AK04-3B TaxID=3028650 RepID=UPI0029BFE347|nr:SpoIIE family protein phosphatase [Streptomyces sp. AK04-3B]